MTSLRGKPSRARPGREGAAVKLCATAIVSAFIAVASPAAMTQTSRDQFIAFAEQACLETPELSPYLHDLARLGISRNDLCRCSSTMVSRAFSDAELAQIDLHRKPTSEQATRLQEVSANATIFCLGQLTAR